MADYCAMRRSPTPRLWIQDTPEDAPSRWLEFSVPLEILVAHSVAEVEEVVRAAEAATAHGRWAAGYLSYEAAPAFDPAFRIRAGGGTSPLAWFGIFPPPRETQPPGEETVDRSPSRWEATDSSAAYRRNVASIHRSIEAGDTYQVNLTLRLDAAFDDDPTAFFRRLHRAQGGHYGAYLEIDDLVVASASPELFFRLEGNHIVTRPMKGTASRGRTAAEDRERADWLASSAKNRAENLMIVDMVRNDLGRIAQPGSVEVARLFEIEKYPSLWQMTSTVEARTDATASAVFGALFPSASITGAPKIRTMELIAELESTPRGLYTGAIGYLAPNRRAQFNVAIRTVQIDRSSGQARYGTGGGIVWDSTADDEFEETRTKARILALPTPTFDLLETLRWTPEGGFFLLDRHLERLAESAAYFDFTWRGDEISAELESFAATLPGTPQRTRLLLDAAGQAVFESSPLPAPDSAAHQNPWRLALATHPIDSTDRFLFHKTTWRRTYDEARAAWPDHDDVLLWNEHGELTESTIANLVVEIDGRNLTPALDCGLLPGTLRAELLAGGEVTESRLTPGDLARATAIHLINSVRGWIPAEFDRSTLPESDRP